MSSFTTGKEIISILASLELGLLLELDFKCVFANLAKQDFECVVEII